jgi:hypothetical protein
MPSHPSLRAVVVGSSLAGKGIRFVNQAAERIDPVARTVTTSDADTIN